MRTSRSRSMQISPFFLAFACATAERPAGTSRTQEATVSTPAAPSAQAVPARAGERPTSSATTGLEQPDTLAGADAARVEELARKAEPLVDAFLNTEAELTRDGKQVIVVSNQSSLPQLYVADASRPDSPARRLFESKERVTLDQTTPDGKAVLFRSDRGADEKWSIWRAGLDGSEPVELTPGERIQRDRAHVADLSPDSIYFSARRISDVGSAVFAASATGVGPAREVYRDKKPGFLRSVSRDGKQGLFVRFPSRSENHLLRLDLASGKTVELYPGSGKVSIFDAQFSPDGRTVFVATDGGGEQAWLLALDTESGKEKARYVEEDPPISSISSVAVAKRGNALALTIDAGNHNEIRLLDALTLRPRAKVQMRLGQGFAPGFSEDGTRLVAIWSTPSSPSDVWSIDSATGKAAPLRAENRPSLREVPAMDVSITSIRAHDGLTIPINVLRPKGQGGKMPVIVSYHGGPSGSSRIRWSALTAFFISQGYAWVEPNVRGSGGFGRAFEEADNGPKRLEAFKDIESTGRWAAAQPWADPKRVIVMGGSYGGYTVLVALTRMPDLWRAGVDLFGVANLKTFMATTSGIIREIFLVEFGDPDKDQPFLDSISPLRYVQRIVAPLFVYAGANDPRVPRTESDLIVRALRDRKVPVEYMVAENEGHSLSRKENVVQFLARSQRFLEQHVGMAAQTATR